jgi:hypothetical protein
VRRSARIACQIVRLRDFKLVADRIENLSPHGVLSGPSDPVLTGEPVLVSFCVPNSRIWIDAFASVARVVHGRRPGETTRRLGIVFDGLPAGVERCLVREMGRKPPIPPGSRPAPFRGRNVSDAVRALRRVSRRDLHGAIQLDTTLS